MNAMNLEQDAFLSVLKMELGARYTEEQLDLIRRFGDGPTFCFASPGTGKTFTAVGGLINAELHKAIPGQNIYAMSFTRLATGELAIRHKEACKTLRISNNVNFSTLHALCRTILLENYRLLGMSKCETGSKIPFDTSYRLVEGVLEEKNVLLTPSQIRSAINAVDKLNASMCFEPTAVQSKMAFKQTGINYDLFDYIRGTLFNYSVLTETIAVSDLLLYTLMLLTRHPEISIEFKKKCKLLLVDEAQDLTLLQLRVISLLSDNVILIGDMKQQIFGFNGACTEIVAEAHRLFPDMKDMKLSQSFRCKNEIAEYATKIILHNKIGGEDYKGIGDGGQVRLLNGLYEQGADIKSLAQKLHDEYVMNAYIFKRTYMFLDRTNIGLLPVIEELYQQHLPFRTNSYVKAYEIPLIKEMCELIAMCVFPEDCRRVTALRYIIPEFRGMQLDEIPYYVIMRKQPQPFFEVHYQFQNPEAGHAAIMCLEKVSDMLNEKAQMKDILNTLWPLFNKCYVTSIAWKLDAKPQYYIDSAAPLMHKTYAKFLQDENQKVTIIEDNVLHNRGIRCYTMHASKGLEADVVYIIDANEGLIPNQRKLEQMVKAECHMDAARSVREERALCYVACTRAKDELNIVTTQSECAAMLAGVNTYSAYDTVYENYVDHSNDIDAFTQFAERYVPEYE